MIRKIKRWIGALATAKKKYFKYRFLKNNKRKREKKCYICKEEFLNFCKFESNLAKPLFPLLQIVGSDTNNFGCYYCGCNDRERHLFLYFDKLNLWEMIRKSCILHIAPEKQIMGQIEKYFPKEYVKGDIFPNTGMIRVDITEIQFPNKYFDFIICNHVIEHIPDYLKAFSELDRVLNDGGIIILQTPYSELLFNHFEDNNINTNDLRKVFYGQYDHVRIISKRQFFEELRQFFILNIIESSKLFSDEECSKYGVNNKEDLIMLKKRLK